MRCEKHDGTRSPPSRLHHLSSFQYDHPPSSAEYLVAGVDSRCALPSEWIVETCLAIVLTVSAFSSRFCSSTCYLVAATVSSCSLFSEWIVMAFSVLQKQLLALPGPPSHNIRFTLLTFQLVPPNPVEFVQAISPLSLSPALYHECEFSCICKSKSLCHCAELPLHDVFRRVVAPSHRLVFLVAVAIFAILLP